MERSLHTVAEDKNSEKCARFSSGERNYGDETDGNDENAGGGRRFAN
jgi:hypothetical protein